ncbi:YidC/Oxa1 family membrane protein insertase [Rodentibacter pneumotropicus]|uniref:Membrane protein insertase YidC n=1 Tax=Rodentibacter pneumotropicus TaxID=758 RepID=A0A3S4Y0R2_9PAST|nr:YidC/Oxa1 family membrane protein insertase [Rodentibacter pneumotropicus]
MKDANLSINTKAGWVAVLQHYFVSAWIPNQDVDNQLYTLTDTKIMWLQLVIAGQS